MRVVLRLAAHELRARWAGWAVLVLLVAVAGGAVLTAVAGARRTATAYPRFLHASHASDLLVAPAGTGVGGYDAALARLPGVAQIDPVVGLNVQPVGPGGQVNLAAVTQAPLDRQGSQLNIPKVLAGRLPRPDRPGEIAVTPPAAAQLHVRLGGLLAMKALANPGPGRPGSPAGLPRRLAERVVGIIVTRSSVVPVTDNDRAPYILASTALWHRLGPRYRGFDGTAVKLSPGAAAGTVGSEAQALARRFPSTGNVIYLSDEGAQVAAIQRSIRPEAVSLAVFALVLAVTALLIIGQAAARLLAAAANDHPVLAALGMTRGQLTAAGLAEAAVAGVAGALLAAGVAVAASPLMPAGAARLAEPDPGISVDWAVLVPGAAAIVVLLLALAAWPAWRLSGVRAISVADASAGGGAGPGSRLATWLAGWGAPLAVTAGVRLALESGRGRSAVLVRAALASTILAVLAVTAAGTFGANLLRFVSTPQLYGRTWDAAVDVQFQTVTPGQAERWFGHSAAITGWTFGDHGVIRVNGAVVPAIGLAPGRGPLLAPALLSGHPPRTSHEIVLGRSILHRLGLRVGQQAQVSVSGHRGTARIVGSAVFPYFGQGGFTPTDLGEGAETTAALLRPQVFAPPGAPGHEFVLVKFAHGPAGAAAAAGFRRSLARFCSTVQQSTCVVFGQRPNTVTDYARIDGTPAVLAGLLAVIGVAVLGQLAVISGHRRRHDFAVLRALGLLRRQVSEITAWQASVHAAVALLIGLPLGVAAGRWAWQLFATGLGVPADPVVPVPLVLLMVPAVILIANVVAWWPGWSAARISPAQVLRTE